MTKIINFLALFSVIFASSTCSDVSGDSEKICGNIESKKVPNISPYQFSTIGKIIHQQDTIALYNVDYEYSTDSVAFILLYDGDILGAAESWFLISNQKIYIQSADFDMIDNDKIKLSIKYQDTKHNECNQVITLPQTI